MRQMKLLASLVALGLSAPAFALTDAEVASALKQRLDGDRTGACFAVAVVEAQGVSRAFRCADAKADPRIGPASAFEIGSVSKTMASALLAQQILAGGASLDDPLADWLPEGSTVPTFEGQPILLRHVVSHTSGLPALPPGVAITDPNDPYAGMSPKMLQVALGRVQLARAPGSAFEYSNFAMMLLSDALARRSGKDFEALLDERLFTPLGMAGAYVDNKPDGVTSAQGHGPNTQAVPAWTFQPGLAGVGGVRATLDDMVAYVQGQLGSAPETLMPALELSQQPVWTSGQPTMAMNWVIAPLNGRPVHVHEGGTGGFSSLVAFDRDAARGVVVLSDTAVHSLGGLGSMGMHLLDPAVPLGKPRIATPAPAELIDALTGDYLLQGGMKLSLRRKGDALEVQAQGQPAFVMGHDSAGDFYPLAFDALLKPVKQPDGSQSFVWIQGGGAIPAQRIDADGANP